MALRAGRLRRAVCRGSLVPCPELSGDSPELLPVSCALAEALPSRGQTGGFSLGAAAAPRPQRLRAGRRAKPPRVGFLRSRDRVPFPERV